MIRSIPSNEDRDKEENVYLDQIVSNNTKKVFIDRAKVQWRQRRRITFVSFLFVELPFSDVRRQVLEETDR